MICKVEENLTFFLRILNVFGLWLLTRSEDDILFT